MTTKSQRLNLRVSPQALEALREAAELQCQDLTSFILGAALDRARTVAAEDMVLRLSPFEIAKLERELASDAVVVPQLRSLVAGVRKAQADTTRPADLAARSAK